MFEKLKFWKKEDEVDFDKVTDEEIEKHSFDDEQKKSLGLDEKSPFPEESPALDVKKPATQYPIETGNREFDLINSKLDTLKAVLLSIEQRIAKLEQGAGEKKEKLW